MQKSVGAKGKREDDIEAFAHADDLAKALAIAWRHPSYKGVYAHYTTLDRLIEKILTKRWWLTRSTNTRLNDRQEAEKFGNRALLARTYQTSFSRGGAENVAMWALYTSLDPLAVRVAIPGKVMKEWTDSIHLPSQSNKVDAWKTLDVKGKNHPVYADFKDVIYAAVGDPRKDLDEYDKKRADSLTWHGVRSKKIKNLECEILADRCTGWMKDLEWQSEQETRLCVRLERNKNNDDAISIKIPDYVIASMSFTFSPWASDRDGTRIERIIKAALVAAKLKENDRAEEPSMPYRRSVLNGALNLEETALAEVKRKGKLAVKKTTDSKKKGRTQ